MEMLYRGLSAHSALLDALANQQRASRVDTSDFIDPQVGWLDHYQAAKDCQSMLNLTETMLAESVPGDLNWTVAKLYEGIALLSQSPADIQKGNAALDEVLASDFKGKPGRDHYVIGAAEWRMRGAFLDKDYAKAMQLAQWVQTNDFRADLKASFVKRYQSVLAPLEPAAK